MSREQKSVDWRELAKTLTPRTQAFIDGKYVPAVSGATNSGTGTMCPFHLSLGTDAKWDA